MVGSLALIVFAAVLAACLRGPRRRTRPAMTSNPHRWGSLRPGRLSGSFDVPDRDAARVAADLVALRGGAPHH